MSLTFLLNSGNVDPPGFWLPYRTDEKVRCRKRSKQSRRPPIAWIAPIDNVIEQPSEEMLSAKMRSDLHKIRGFFSFL